MESYITLSFLNDFIFCPRSIYFHQLYAGFNEHFYKQKPQFAGTEAHSTIDNKSYSTRNDVLMGIEVYTYEYNIAGKIDVFDCKTGKLIERKNEIKQIYDGYVFQVYAQCFALREMGYHVTQIVIHDISQNKNYAIPLPEDDNLMLLKFRTLIQSINNFDLNDISFIPNIEKCKKCVYSTLCDKALC